MSLYDVLPDIPRMYTAVAEWAACMVYILLLKKRAHGPRFWLGAAFGLALQCVIQWVAGRLPLAFWVPGMAAAVLGMYCMILALCALRPRDAGYLVARAFVLAEFVASLEWQVYCYFLWGKSGTYSFTEIAFVVPVYALLFVAAYFMEGRHMQRGGRLHVARRELFSAIGIALAVFLISNISFADISGPFSSRQIPELFYIRTLVDFCGFVILYAQQEQRREMQLKYELEAIQTILQRQFEQYQLSRESMDLVNHKYHDLKHQIAVIRAEEDPDKRAEYLAEMEKGIKMYEAQNKTGNKVLDTVLMSKSLACQEQDITLTCVADGTLLDFMEVMDICTVFGNALDNAMESVRKIPDVDKRLIRVALYAQNDFVMMRFENYYETEIRLEDGLPKTTKPDKGYHGFGLKSIQYTAEKYDGSLTIHTEDGWFILRVLIPQPDAVTAGTQLA